MTKKNWIHVADKQFTNLEPAAQKDWADLRKRVNQFVINRHVHYYH